MPYELPKGILNGGAGARAGGGDARLDPLGGTRHLRAMLVCSRCGVAPPLFPSTEPRCRSCVAPLELVERHAEPAEWARFQGWFACRACGQRSPFSGLPSTGAARCLHCFAESPFASSDVARILASGHDNVDVACARVPTSFRPHLRDLLADASVAVMDAWELNVLPGIPLCPGCGGALAFSGDGATVVASCARCDRRDAYHRPEGVPYAEVACVLDDDHRVAPVARAVPGATALACSSCGAPLPASVAPVVTCVHCKMASRLPLEVRARAADAAPVWVCFRGESSARREHRASAEAANAPVVPVPAAPASVVDRHFEKFFLAAVAVVMAIALVIGILSRL